MTRFDQTLVSLFADRVRRDGRAAALLHRPGEAFTPVTWNQLAADATAMARFLVANGLNPGHRVVQVSENRFEWIVLDLAIHLAQGIHVAVHAPLTGPQIAYQIGDSGASLVVVSGPEQAAKLATLADQLPPGLKYLAHEKCEVSIAGEPIELLRPKDDGGDDDEALLAWLDECAENVTPDDLATILYTSGTTGEPKGVMLSHRNLAFNALATLAAFPANREDVRLCWLPLSHIYARTSDYYTWVAGHSTLALAKSRETIIDDCKSVRPTLLNGVPYFYDKVARRLQESGKADVSGALRELLGGKIRCCCAGGAALADQTAEFFQACGVTLVQGYGLTESSPVITTCCSENNRIGTVGPPIPGVEVRIGDDGEVLTRGDHVMVGYWKKPEATAASIQDGWLHTGDLGRLDEGYLRITGRKKEIIVTAAGKNIAPTLLEGLLTQDSLIAQAVVFGDARNYLTALIVPNRDALRAQIIGRGIPITSAAEALVHPTVKSLYREAINHRLAELSHCEQIGKFTLIGRGFTIESGEFTPTLKLRREEIARNFAEEIASMYRWAEQSAVECDV